MSQLSVPGVSLAVIENFEVVEVLVIGVAEQATQEVVTEQTVFQAASISKTLTAVATLKWATDNQISFDISINDLLTAWQLPENNLTQEHKATIEGILRHTAGINVSGFPGYNQSKALPMLAQILTGNANANTEAIQVTNAPNSQCHYSGGGYTVSQQVIENQTDMLFQDFMNFHIIDFLGLDNSTFEQVSSSDNLMRSSGHLNGNSPINGYYHIYPEQAAAGYWTNARDLAQFAIQLQLSLKGGITVITC